MNSNGNDNNSVNSPFFELNSSRISSQLAVEELTTQLSTLMAHLRFQWNRWSFFMNYGNEMLLRHRFASMAIGTFLIMLLFPCAWILGGLFTNSKHAPGFFYRPLIGYLLLAILIAVLVTLAILCIFFVPIAWRILRRRNDIMRI